MTRELWTQWQQTKTCWKDAKSEEFERKHLKELLGTVERTVAIMEQLDKLLENIKDDCE